MTGGPAERKPGGMTKPIPAVDPAPLSNSDKFEAARRILKVLVDLSGIEQREILVILAYRNATEIRKALGVVEHLTAQDRADVCRCLAALIGGES